MIRVCELYSTAQEAGSWEQVNDCAVAVLCFENLWQC